MWYGCCSKNDISGEIAPYSFQSVTQRFLAPVPKPTVPLQLPQSSTPSQYWTSCFSPSDLLLRNYTVWSLTLILDEDAFTLLWQSPDKNCSVCKAPPWLLRFTWGPLWITSDWGQVVHLPRLCFLRLTIAIYFTERYLEPGTGNKLSLVFLGILTGK